MQQFLKFLLASCLGVILATVVIFAIGVGIISAIASSADQPKTISPNSVLHLTFEQPIPELTNNLDIDPFDFENQKILGLNDILYVLEAAGEDDKIKGIFLEIEGVTAGFATSSLLRKALEDFRSTGKFIISYSRYHTQGAYYLSSTADQLYLNPIGLVDLRGLSAQVPFFKDMLDKLGVNPQVFYAGKFKSATEPFRRNDMSPENKYQVREYIEQMYRLFLEDISRSRNISVVELRRIANSYLGAQPEDAVKYGLIDRVGYRDQALDDMKERLGLDKDEDIKTVKLVDYYQSNKPPSNFSIKNKIAVIYAEGTVVDGKGSMGTIGDTKYVKLIENVAEDDNIKALVLRVNSPGGSAMSSENIWRALSLFKETGKPLIVSMGDYAASGGYYIACIGDTIFSQPNTLTGSIGVFSVIPSFQKLLNEKIGIRFDTVKTGSLSHGIGVTMDLSEAEKAIMQNRTDQLYNIFLNRVADGRNLPVSAVDDIAQGRVWTGLDAQKIGLVDRIGSIEDAIASAASLTGLEEYRLVEYPKPKEPLMEFIEKITGSEMVTQRAIKAELGSLYPYYQFFADIRDSKGAQARLPFLIPFE